MEETESSPPSLSVAGRIVNIFAAPGEVFDDIMVFLGARRWIR